jgi:hypothetical protein
VDRSNNNPDKNEVFATMAQKVIVELVDDLDGTASADVNTVNFALDGARYEIDLTEHNANRLRDAVADYVVAVRRTGGRIKRGASPATSPPARSDVKGAERSYP